MITATIIAVSRLLTLFAEDLVAVPVQDAAVLAAATLAVVMAVLVPTGAVVVEEAMAAAAGVVTPIDPIDTSM